MRDSALKRSGLPCGTRHAGRRRAHARQRFETCSYSQDASTMLCVGEELMRDSALKHSHVTQKHAVCHGRRRAHARQRFETLPELLLLEENQ